MNGLPAMDDRAHSEQRSCPACGGVDASHWFVKHGYDHWRCTACGHGFVHPIPAMAEIAAYYAALNDGLSSDCSWSTEPRHKIVLWRRLLGAVLRGSGRGPLLDIGCGAGQFLKLAAEEGWHDAQGIEIAPKAAAMAREAAGAHIHEGAWRDVTLAHGHFAAAAMLDVLEHDPAPGALLRQVFDWLRPGGSLIITVPNIHGLSLRCLGSNAYVAIPPEHLSYFSRRSMERMLSRAGFSTAYHATCDIYLKEWLRFLPRRRPGAAEPPPDALQRARYERAYRRMTGTLALHGIGALNRVLGVAGAGDQRVVIARKPAPEQETP